MLPSNLSLLCAPLLGSTRFGPSIAKNLVNIPFKASTRALYTMCSSKCVVGPITTTVSVLDDVIIQIVIA